MEVEIKKIDHLARGIGYIDGKVVFVPFTIPKDIVDIKIVKDNKNYMEGVIQKVIQESPDRVKGFCPYFEKCGGCFLGLLSYENTIKYKKERIQNILSKAGICLDVDMIANKENLHYRNKIELKIKNGLIGFYKYKSHDIVEISSCMVADNCLNEAIKLIKTFNLNDANVMVRCNFNKEVLISIKSKDKINFDKNLGPQYKVAGIIYNDKVIYGDSKFIDKINDTYFEVSYDAFFQVNPYINSNLFNIIKDNTYGQNVLDLYSGVGTLAIMASKNANKVYAIESVLSAVKNAIYNAKINNINNAFFICGKVEDKISFIKDKIDTVIVDPPRSGLDDKTINYLMQIAPSKIIYISCETQKMAYDLTKLLSAYKVTKIYGLDMFSYSYHVETVCILERK